MLSWERATNLYVGTSGYSYPKWKDGFYPKELPASQMLRYYGEQFRTVEVNYTFRRMPTAALLAGWAHKVPADFRFVLKAPDQITHQQRLKDVDAPLSHLLQVAGVLGDRLGPLLFQLPPNFQKDAARLRDFLTLLPSSCRAAFEFRHPSWFDAEVFGLLRDGRDALCIAEAEDGLDIPFVATTDWSYLRLRRPDYDRRELSASVQRLREHDWRDVRVLQARGPRERPPAGEEARGTRRLARTHHDGVGIDGLNGAAVVAAPRRATSRSNRSRPCGRATP